MKWALLFILLVAGNLIGMELPRIHFAQQWDGKYFHKHTKESLSLAKRILAGYPIEHYENILDIGCGPGGLTAHMARRARKARVHGIDPSADMIRFAREHYKRQKNLVVSQFESPTSDMGGQDFVFSCDAFHLVPKALQSQVLARWAQTARQDRVAHLVLIMAAKTRTPQPFERAYTATLQMADWAELRAVNLDDYFQPHDQYTFPDVMERAGTDFRIRQMDIVDELIVFKNVSKLTHFVTSWMGGFGFFAALSKGKQKKLIGDLMGNYVQVVPPASNKSIEWRSPRFVVHATKFPQSKAPLKTDTP